MSLVDMRIDVDEYFLPKVAVAHRHRRCSSLPCSPSPLAMMDARSCNTFYYSKLPEEPLKLSILKLDGSSFDIEVKKSATVAELRHAVEDAFSHMPQKGPGKISWPHVWGHFCLTYDGQNLVMETDYIRNYGIKDGDRLQFIRHLSTTYSLRKKSSIKWIAASGKHNNSPSRSNGYKEKEQNDKEDHCDIEIGKHLHYDEKGEDIIEHDESKWACFFKRWFSYSRLPTMERRSLKTYPPRFSSRLWGRCRMILEFCRSNHCSRRPRWREGL